MVILASGSPRRKELLQLLNLEYQVITSDVDETPTKEAPEEIVMELSKRKCDDVYEKAVNDQSLISGEENLIIAADTLVFFENERLGKPENEEHAKEMIRKLSGNVHYVITGVTLIYTNKGKKKETSFFEKTEVRVCHLTEKEIDDYVATKEPMDKAGAYAIQGYFAKFIEGISGDYSNVVGLPVSRLYHEMKEIGFVKYF